MRTSFREARTQATLSLAFSVLVIGSAVPSAGPLVDRDSRISNEPDINDTGPRVHARFDLSRPDGGPFPSDIFTVPDSTQNTGRRVNLPYPDCAIRVSDCEDLDVINTLDGFGLQTRVSIPFDGAIDPTTVTDQTVFLISLSSARPGDEPGGKRIGVNQIVWDPDCLTLHVETHELLEQYRQYAVIVTRASSIPPVCRSRRVTAHERLCYFWTELVGH